MADERIGDDDSLLAAEYALGLLSAAETAAFEERLSVEPRLRAHYARWADDFADLAARIPAQSPPPAVWDAVQRDVFPQPERRRRRPWMAALATLVAGGAVAALLLLLVGDDGLFITTPDEPVASAPRLVADLQSEDGPMRINAAYRDDANQLSIELTQGDAPEGRVLELWLIVPDTPAISLGVLSEDDPQSVIDVPEELVALLEGGVLAVTDEPPGGAPGGVASGQVRALGPLTPT